MCGARYLKSLAANGKGMKGGIEPSALLISTDGRLNFMRLVNQ